MKRTDDALASYTRTIDLSRNQAGIGSWVFEEMAALYAAQGRFCEAMSPIETYISFGGADRANDRTGRLLDDYAEKGQCDRQAASSESFPVLDSGIVNVRATINGIAGSFVIDTGAIFVSLNESFADRAHVTKRGFAETQTANGKTLVRRALAASVRLGSLEARNVSLVILDRPIGGADGLLGRSFLARFEMIFDRPPITTEAQVATIIQVFCGMDNLRAHKSAATDSHPRSRGLDPLLAALQPRY